MLIGGKRRQVRGALLIKEIRHKIRQPFGVDCRHGPWSLASAVIWTPDWKTVFQKDVCNDDKSWRYRESEQVAKLPFWPETESSGRSDEDRPRKRGRSSSTPEIGERETNHFRYPVVKERLITSGILLSADHSVQFVPSASYSSSSSSLFFCSLVHDLYTANIFMDIRRNPHGRYNNTGSIYL